MNLNKEYDESAAMFGIRVNLSLLSTRELREIRATIDEELAMKAERHLNTIRAAIEAAMRDNFNVAISTKGDLDNMVCFTPNDEKGIDVYID